MYLLKGERSFERSLFPISLLVRQTLELAIEYKRDY
jgi:hypothetical protein